jgi:hypothetical protein
MTYDQAKKRKQRILNIELRDHDRFKPSPLGPGFLTRRERYTELYREIDKRTMDDTLDSFCVGTVH